MIGSNRLVAVRRAVGYLECAMDVRSLRLWHLVLVVGLATALVFSVAGIVCVHQWSERSIDVASVASQAEARAFASAVSSWVVTSLPQTHLLSRVIQIALESDTVYVVITSLGKVLVDERAVGWKRMTLPDRVGDEPTMVIPIAGTLVLDTSVPVGDGSVAQATVRMGTLAHHLQDQLQNIKLSTAGIAFGLWAFGLLLFTTWRFRHGARADAKQRSEAGGPRPLPASNSVSFPLMIDARAKQVSYQDLPVPIAPKLFQLLELLLTDDNRVFTEQEIIDHVWTDSHYATAADVRQCVYRLRCRLNEIEAGLGECVANVKGFGYRFDPNRLSEPTDELA